MHPSVERYLAITGKAPRTKLTIDPEPGESQFAFALADFPGCIAQGPTLAVAIERLLAIMPRFLEEVVAAGLPLPEPRPTVSFLSVGKLDVGGRVEPAASVLPAIDAAELANFKATPTTAAA